MSNNFNDPFAANLVGLWDFLDSGPTKDTGLADGIAQNGELEGGASVSGGRLHTDGSHDFFDVKGNNDGPFDLSEGTVAVQFTQDDHVGSSPDVIVNRGEYDDRGDEGWFAISVTKDGKVTLDHADGGDSAHLATDKNFFNEGDKIKATYSWSQTDGLTFKVENLDQNTETTITSTQTGLTMDVTDNDDESWTFAAREDDDGDYDRFFDGSIDYVAVYDKDIQNAGDGIVSGTNDAETIDLAYDDDPEGDKIDNNDAVLAGQSGDQDIVDALGGDDRVEAGMEGDTVYAGSGDDTVLGEGGNDTIFGDSNAPGGGGTVRESFEWDEIPDTDGGSGNVDDGDPLQGGVTQNTGNVDVTFSVVSADPHVRTEFADNDQKVHSITDDGNGVDPNSSLASELDGGIASATYAFDFSKEVENVSFRINDIDGDGAVKVFAFDAAGDPVALDITAGSKLTATDADGVGGTEVLGGDGDYEPDTSGNYSGLINIAGPVSRIEVEHFETGPNNSGINITDMYFDAPVGPVDNGPDGNDELLGGDGNDEIFGEGGDDTLNGGAGNDFLDGGEGDNVIIGGDGADTVVAGDGNNDIDTSGTGIPLVDDKNGDGFGFAPYGPLPAAPADGNEADDRDSVTSGSGDDTIKTGDDDDIINAGAGDNVIDAGIDDDEITTLIGDDTIVGGEGSDTISSGAGEDLIYGGLDPAVVPFDGTNIPNAPDGGSFGPDPDEENGRDSIDAGGGNDTVFGQDDDDTISGGDGNDFLDGGVDDDLIYGDEGRDTIFGGQGADTLFGNAGSDEFRIVDREDAFGDEVDGGTEDGDNDPATDNENDQLDLRGLGRFQIVESDGTTPLDFSTPNDADGNSFTGQVNFLDANDNVEGVLKFTEIEDVIPCFTPGTVIATPKGERMVEELQVGDRIITRDNGLQEIRWVGRRDMTAQELMAAPHLKPVLIRAGSLGHGLPERDMMVSPQHRVLINNERSALYFDDREVLAAAKHLTGIEGVDPAETRGVSYIHFMFDQHEVVLSNGAWTESFQPGEQVLDGMGNAQKLEIFELFPELQEAEGLKAYQAARRSLKQYEARLLVD